MNLDDVMCRWKVCSKEVVGKNRIEIPVHLTGQISHKMGTINFSFSLSRFSDLKLLQMQLWHEISFLKILIMLDYVQYRQTDL